MKRSLNNLSSFSIIKTAFFVCVFAVLGAASSQSVTHADSFSNISPNPEFMMAGGENGGISHLLKNETVARVTEINLGVYYHKSKGINANGKVLQIARGLHGEACSIAGNMTGSIIVSIYLANKSKDYSVPLQQACAPNSNFFTDYPFPDGNLKDEAGYYMARIKIHYSYGTSLGQSDQNSVNFKAILKGDNSNDGVIAPLANDNPRQYGLRSSWYGQVDKADNKKVQARVQFGYPCDASPSPSQRTLKLYDADSVFGNTYIWITKITKNGNRHKLDRSEYDTPKPDEPDPKLKGWDSDNKRWLVDDSNNGHNYVRMAPGVVHPENGDSYEFVVLNDGVGSERSPHSNVLSVSIPYDAIYTDVNCGSTESEPFRPVIDINEYVVEPSDDDPYNVRGHVKRGPVEVAPGREAPKVPVELHRAIYDPDQTPFGGGSSQLKQLFWRGYYGNPKIYDPVDSSPDVAAPSPDYWYPQPARSWHAEAFRPDFRVKDGSTTCFILAVQQPPTVKQHTYQYQVYIGNDKDGNPIYATYSATDYWYSDENYTTPGNALSYYHYDKVERTWVHAVDCVTVGKRPKVQILGNDSRVRGDSKTKLTHYNDAYFGSWIEYGALSTKIDDAPASGAGYRNGTSVDVGSRMAWSKLTFANTDTYGNYTSLPAPPNIAGYYEERAHDPLTSGSLSGLAAGTYRKEGNVSVAGDNIDKTIVIYATGTVTITDNITYKNGDYTSLSQIPQVIIIAKNINIQKNVGRIDAWLIADGNGNSTAGKINTCSDGPSTESRNSKDCNAVLEVNGPVIADALYLNRTGPDRYDAAAPAEIFRLRPDAYLWAVTRQQSTGAARTVDIVELPPRF